MKLVVLLTLLAALTAGAFYLVKSQHLLQVNDWRIELLVAVLLVGVPASLAARAM